MEAGVAAAPAAPQDAAWLGLAIALPPYHGAAVETQNVGGAASASSAFHQRRARGSTYQILFSTWHCESYPG